MSRDIITRPELKFHEAVKLIESHLIKPNNYGFFVQSEVGLVGVEICYDGYDPFDPVFVSNWYDAPPTQWSTANNKIDAMYYISIGTGRSAGKVWDHLMAITAMMKLLYFAKGDKPDQLHVDMSVLSYLMETEKRIPTLNILEKEFSKINLGFITKNNPLVRELVRRNFELRIRMAQDKLNNIPLKGDVFMCEMEEYYEEI